MKYFLKSFLIIYSFWIVGCTENKQQERLPVADLEELKGSWVLVNYWAEWCAPCRDEIPEFNEIFHKRGETNVYVLGVNFDGIRGSELEALMQRMGIDFPQLAEDPSASLNQSTPEILPTTYVIDPSGSLVNIMVGPQTTESLEAVVGI